MLETLGQESRAQLEVPLALRNNEEYFCELAEEIRRTQPGDRVIVATMSFEPNEQAVDTLLTELNSAAERKVDTLLIADAYTFIRDSVPASIGPSLLPNSFRQAAFERRKQSLQNLADKPYANVAVINQPERYATHPFKGRSHLKGAIVNDKVWIAGTNLHNTDQIDAAVSLEDSDVADLLSEILALVAAEGTTKILGNTDLTFPVDATTDIMIDTGVAGQSAIYERATRILREAEEWTLFTSQFVPSGEVADILRENYQHDIDTLTYFNHTSKWGPIGGIAQKLVLAKQMLHMPAEFKQSMLPPEATSLHAKTVANQSEAGIGTHNSAPAGVRLGTPEIMLFRKSPAFADAIRTFVQHEIELDIATSKLRSVR